MGQSATPAYAALDEERDDIAGDPYRYPIRSDMHHPATAGEPTASVYAGGCMVVIDEERLELAGTPIDHAHPWKPASCGPGAAGFGSEQVTQPRQFDLRPQNGLLVAVARQLADGAMFPPP